MAFKSKEVGFLKVCNDRGWSMMTSKGIIVYILVKQVKLINHSWAEIYDFVKRVLSFKLPGYHFLSVIAFYFIVKL